MWLGDNKTKISFPHCWKMHSWETLVLKIFRGGMPPDPPRCSGLRPSVLRGTCLLTSQCPSTSKVNENPVKPTCNKCRYFMFFFHVEYCYVFGRILYMCSPYSKVCGLYNYCKAIPTRLYYFPHSKNLHYFFTL